MSFVNQCQSREFCDFKVAGTREVNRVFVKNFIKSIKMICRVVEDGLLVQFSECSDLKAIVPKQVLGRPET